MKTKEQIDKICKKELKEFNEMSKKELIQEVYKLRLCLMKNNYNMIKRNMRKK